MFGLIFGPGLQYITHRFTMTGTAAFATYSPVLPAANPPRTHNFSRLTTTSHLNSSSVPPSSSPPTPVRAISRRACLLALALAPIAPAIGAPAPPKETILNSVLSAYGLPTLSDKPGFSLLSHQYGRLIVQFEYPTAWVVNRGPPSLTTPTEGRTSTLSAADYRRAEGLSFFAQPVTQKAVNDVPQSDIVRLVTPGDATTGDGLVAVSVTSDRMVKLEGEGDESVQGFRVIETKYESTTASGYTVERKARTRCTVLKDGRLYALNGSGSANRWKKINADINTSLDSFRVFIL